MSQIIFNAIIAIIIFNYLLDRILHYLNQQSYSTRLPKEAEGIYDPEKYKKSQEYHKVSDRFSFLTSTFSLMLILGMLFFNGFALADNFARGYTDNPILIAIIFFGILGLASDLLSIPFEL